MSGGCSCSWRPKEEGRGTSQRNEDEESGSSLPEAVDESVPKGLLAALGCIKAF